MQKSVSSTSFFLREHRQASHAPSFLQLAFFENTSNGERYDMVKRPGEDVIDVIPWHLNPAGDVIIFSKCDYPRPIANTQPRRMTSNLDGKIWSGHMIEPLAAARQETGETQLTKFCWRAPVFLRRVSARSNPSCLTTRRRR